jgi:hypothetical protein
MQLVAQRFGPDVELRLLVEKTVSGKPVFCGIAGPTRSERTYESHPFLVRDGVLSASRGPDDAAFYNEREKFCGSDLGISMPPIQ